MFICVHDLSLELIGCIIIILSKYHEITLFQYCNVNEMSDKLYIFI